MCGGGFGLQCPSVCDSSGTDGLAHNCMHSLEGTRCMQMQPALIGKGWTGASPAKHCHSALSVSLSVCCPLCRLIHANACSSCLSYQFEWVCASGQGSRAMLRHAGACDLGSALATLRAAEDQSFGGIGPSSYVTFRESVSAFGLVAWLALVALAVAAAAHAHTRSCRACGMDEEQAAHEVCHA